MRSFVNGVRKDTSPPPLGPVATYGALPTAGANNAGAQCYVTGLDATYRCVQTSAGVYAWRLADAGMQDPLDASDLLVWSLNDAAAPAVNAGSSGIGDNLTVGAGAPTFAQSSTPWGDGATYFNATAFDKLTVAGRAANTPNTSCLVRAWVRPLTAPGAAVKSVVERTNTAGNSAVCIYLDGTGAAATGLRFRTYQGVTPKDITLNTHNEVNLAQWHQLLWCTIGNTLYAVCDGNIRGSLALGGAATIDNGGTWTVGSDTGNHAADAIIAAVRVRNHAFAAVADLVAWARRDYARGMGVWGGT